MAAAAAATFFRHCTRMSSLLLRLFVLSAVAEVCLSYKSLYYLQHQQRYPPATFDNFSIESLLTNGRVVSIYMKCLLGTGPCTQEGRNMKRALPEVLRTACNKCNFVERERLRLFLRRVHGDPKLHDAWQKVLDKYDPQRQYAPSLDRFIANRPATILKRQTPQF